MSKLSQKIWNNRIEAWESHSLNKKEWINFQLALLKEICDFHRVEISDKPYTICYQKDVGMVAVTEIMLDISETKKVAIVDIKNLEIGKALYMDLKDGFGIANLYINGESYD